jgi:hypothetical protein
MGDQPILWWPLGSIPGMRSAQLPRPKCSTARLSAWYPWCPTSCGQAGYDPFGLWVKPPEGPNKQPIISRLGGSSALNTHQQSLENIQLITLEFPRQRDRDWAKSSTENIYITNLKLEVSWSQNENDTKKTRNQQPLAVLSLFAARWAAWAQWWSAWTEARSDRPHPQEIPLMPSPNSLPRHTWDHGSQRWPPTGTVEMAKIKVSRSQGLKVSTNLNYINLGHHCPYQWYVCPDMSRQPTNGHGQLFLREMPCSCRNMTKGHRMAPGPSPMATKLHL